MTLLCGFRALRDYGAKELRAARISHSLCAKETEIDEAVETIRTAAEAGVDALGLPELLISFVRGLAGNVVKDEK